ncbi:MAG: LemA family protein [Firmicutes bacterium]|nr:LemA family protein [Bacillota bacterium]
MSTGMIILIVVLVIVVILAMMIAGTYNSLVGLKNRVKDQWAQVDVVLKRRADLIPNLVETVKGYASHEKETLDAVISARNQAVSATNPHDEMEANGVLTQALGRLFAISEAYPDLKANTNFMELQRSLQETEDKIAYARQFYNDTVMAYNNKIEMFPSNIIAGMFHFTKSEFFEIVEKDKEVPNVKF